MLHHSERRAIGDWGGASRATWNTVLHCETAHDYEMAWNTVFHDNRPLAFPRLDHDNVVVAKEQGGH